MKPASAQVMVLFICKRQTDLDNSSREPVSHTTLVGAGKVQGERIHTKLGNQ